ncbi:hypothetical protein [Silvimonas amylolytica]|uniref:Type II secretion system (T2SS), protein M subtype b n=1 Tax=Silvimonas amylolytica TaxID=449663 RepID=A0ABQ2PQN7_9NEIS|nr:hypothetical protein [Silvimonas amylolytica]GGP27934.1 hypothetical protein GCM10010971_37530 [Silvimonas amylolytica]
MKQAQVIWTLRQWPRYAGLLGWVGVALIVAGVLVYRQTVVPFNRDLDRREADVEDQAHRLRSNASAASATAGLQPLKTPDTFTGFLRQVSTLGDKHRIMISQSDYKSTAEADGHLVRYGVQFPAQGKYVDIRGLVQDLQALPGVRVETLVMTRGRIDDDLLSMQLQLSYLTEVR